MRGLATFAFWTVLAATLCAAAFFALATLFFGAHPGAHLEAVAEGRTDALVALLAFVFGTAATVAGAVATVYVSNLALRLSQDGERRETLRFAADRLDEAIEHVADMAAAANALHAGAAELLPELDRFAEGYAVPLHHLRENDQERLLRQHGGTIGFLAGPSIAWRTRSRAPPGTTSPAPPCNISSRSAACWARPPNSPSSPWEQRRRGCVWPPWRCATIRPGG